MFNGYVKAVGTQRMDTRRDEGGESRVIPGFIKWQEQFFFDARDPESVKRAYEAAERHAATRCGKMSIYGVPDMAGPWDDLPRVGEGIGA